MQNEANRTDLNPCRTKPSCDFYLYSLRAMDEPFELSRHPEYPVSMSFDAFVCPQLLLILRFLLATAGGPGWVRFGKKALSDHAPVNSIVVPRDGP